MRGLTKAVEGTDPEAAKARAELGRMGVDVDQLKRGTAGTYDTLLKLAPGSEACPTPGSATRPEGTCSTGSGLKWLRR